jgi:hypothetical protein
MSRRFSRYRSLSGLQSGRTRDRLDDAGGGEDGAEARRRPHLRRRFGQQSLAWDAERLRCRDNRPGKRRWPPDRVASTHPIFALRLALVSGSWPVLERGA